MAQKLWAPTAAGAIPRRRLEKFAILSAESESGRSHYGESDRRNHKANGKNLSQQQTGLGPAAEAATVVTSVP